MDYESWEQDVPEAMRVDTLWKVTAYRLALFLGDIGWHDVTKLSRDRRTHELSDQLCRALGSISANLAEGYSRGTGKDRALFYQYALGSARESRDWYFKGRHILGQAVLQHRLQILTRIIQLLLTMVPQQRGSTLHESKVTYTISTNEPFDGSLAPHDIADVLANVPLPDV